MLFFGLGFISYSVAFLLGRKYEITLTSRALPPVHPVKKYYYDDLSYMGVKFAKVDPLSEPEKVKNLMRAHDVIVNFIGALGNDEQELMRANYEVPKSLVNILQEVNPDALFIHISVAALGQKRKFVEEESPHGSGFEPENALERSKLMGEKEVMKANVRKVILRPTLVYGWAGAHKQFVEGYKTAKRGVIPKIDFRLPVVNVRYLATIIESLAEERPKSDYFYVNECEKVSVTRGLELYCQALDKRCLKVPVPRVALGLAKLFQFDVGLLLKYHDYEFTCNRTKEFVGNPTFVESDVIENAKFLKRLDSQDRLVPE